MNHYSYELMAKEKVKGLLEEGLRSQAVHRSGTPKLGPLHDVQKFIAGNLDWRPNKKDHSMQNVKSEPVQSQYH
jgi:hypothetical protein